MNGFHDNIGIVVNLIIAWAIGYKLIVLVVIMIMINVAIAITNIVQAWAVVIV